jgi:hypothetical protein
MSWGDVRGWLLFGLIVVIGLLAEWLDRRGKDQPPDD